MTDDELERLAELIAERVVSRTVPRLVDANSIAELLGVPASWVLTEARADRIPHVRLGKYRRFDPVCVGQWWSTNTGGPQPIGDVADLRASK